MEKCSGFTPARPNNRPQPVAASNRLLKSIVAVLAVIVLFFVDPFEGVFSKLREIGHVSCVKPIYGTFPEPGEPFHFLPCTNKTRPPSIDDPSPETSWAKLYDPNPDNWSWGKPAEHFDDILATDIYAGRGIYLCGYLDVPMDYTNKSDSRISRLAVTKFQASGMRRLDGQPRQSTGHKSVRTLVVEPGGPGGSGQSMVWGDGQGISERYSNSTFDVLGWDPRGVNATYPAMSCFTSDAHRDRWRLLTNKNRRVVGQGNTIQQLQVADAMNDAMFKYCFHKYGDLPRFMTTAFVARDLERIREALGEDELTGFMVSYGTGIAQIYASMFPDSVGRIILDGNEFWPDYKNPLSFATNSFDNVTDAWRDGFLAGCVDSGPDGCPLARPKKSGEVLTLDSLEARMNALLSSLVDRPLSTYSETSGPALITYQFVVDSIYESTYNPRTWRALAELLNDLETGNTTKPLDRMNQQWWRTDPGAPFTKLDPAGNDELVTMVGCPEGYDQPRPDSLEEWDLVWQNATEASWISGDMRFSLVFPCRQFYKYWPTPAEVYRGGLNKTLKNPLLLISETYDPATPLRNGLRLREALGHDNARLVVHHGFGHGSRGDPSNCTDGIGRRYILEGILPSEDETHCTPHNKHFSASYSTDINDATLFWKMTIPMY
ncbi:hypothetical protein NLG97_g2149 [Lecanicillium saksenae]|uniref:Uncharacterized protein n=1 Tax=Lecanicillium saksenae TaxID=468837 RepID=A0ACC1R1S6_9HYPO|nr:hypothetical protein NLG97_g2149 [Lecanicillium saksenae]